MTNEELIQKLIGEANILREQANNLIALSREINPHFIRDEYIDDIDRDREHVANLENRILMYIEYRDQVTAKEITDRFDFPTGYPSHENETMIAHVFLNNMLRLGYLRRYEDEGEYRWSLTAQGSERCKLPILLEKNPHWEELFF
jgi:hypothetical protein